MQRSLDFDAAPAPRFQGHDYHPSRDQQRLATQYDRVLAAMSDGQWRDLDEIRAITGDPQASISRQLRYAKEAGHVVEREHRGNGRYVYRVVK